MQGDQRAGPEPDHREPGGHGEEFGFDAYGDGNHSSVYTMKEKRADVYL